ncbi:MAG: tetratricopeptide repeat protein [Anaerolineae bacterium]
MTVLRLNLFGKPRILLNDQIVDQSLPAKARATLFYLAVNKQPTSRELLAGLLWSDMPESAARASLRVALSKLRSQFDPHLIINRRDVGLNRASAVEIDADQFLESSAMRQSVKVYTGPFLDDFYLRDASLFERWVEQERQTYHQKAAEYLYRLGAEAAESGDVEQAVQDYQQLLALDPWREEGYRQLMKLLAENGQRGAALAQFDLCRQALQAELDVEPTAETIQLYEQIKAGKLEIKQPEPADQPLKSEPHTHIKSTPHNLQSAALSFIGRQAESEQIKTLLVSDQCSLLTITGPGGIGKTRLANECAHQLLPQFKDGVFLAPLVSLSSADLLPTAIATAFGLSLQGQKTPQEQLFSYLGTKNILLILDNFEHLLDGIDFLTDLMATASDLKILVTSREPLNMAAEWVLPLTGLPYSANLEQPAAKLFTNRAQRLDLSFTPEREEAEIGRICALVEGMPLAIELASAWVRVISCHEIAAEIESNLDFLATDLDLVPTHQRSIRAVFAYSWSLLPEEAQKGFAKLAIFRGGFTRGSADKVAGVTLRTLTTLVDKSLLQKEAGGRFHIHPLLRQFGLEHLSPEEHEVASVSYANYFATLLSQHETGMYSSDDPDLVLLVQSEIENIRAVWEWLAQNRTHKLFIQQLLPITGYYFQRCSLFHEGLRLFERLLTGSGEWLPELEAQVQVQAATFDTQLGHFDIGKKRLAQALPVLQQADLVKPAAEGFYFLGIIYLRMGDFPQALERLNDSYALFKAVQNELGCSRASNVMGIVAATEGRYPDAERYYREALTTQQTHNYQRGVANLLSNLGSVYGRQSQYEKALRYYQEAEVMTKQLNDIQATAVILSNLGSVSRSLEKHQDAIKYYEESLLLTIEVGDQRWIAANYNGLGLTFFELGQYQNAINQLRQGLATALAIQALPDALTALTQLGRVLLKQGDIKTGASWLTFAINQQEAPAISRQEAENALAAITAGLTVSDKESIISQASSYSFADMQQAVDIAFGDHPL